MGRKRKKDSRPAPSGQVRLFALEPAGPEATPAAAPPETTRAQVPPSPGHPDENPDSPEFLRQIQEDGIRWAGECGLHPPFGVNGPERVEYPRAGHGYVVTIQEEEGKRRLGTARFNARGEPTYWSLDGILSG